jgi:RNA polymerase sigma factor (sigma-70 family)
VAADSDLVRAAAGGDRSAWDRLEALYGPRMWSVARACGLSSDDAADAVQGAWLRLLERITTIKDTERVGAWLATTTRREALLIQRKSQVPALPAPVEAADPAAAYLESEHHTLLWETVSALREPCRSILRLAAADLSNQQVATRLGIPVGSVGPTRSRCLNKLRTHIPEESVL